MGLVEAGIWPPSGRTAQYEPTHNVYYVKWRINLPNRSPAALRAASDTGLFIVYREHACSETCWR